MEISLICHSTPDQIDTLISPLPDSIAHYRYWQFGSGTHASEAKPIRGSVLLNFISDSGSTITIRHVVISGSSPWVLGRNITRKCDLVHLDGNFIRFPPTDGLCNTLSMINIDEHSYVTISCSSQMPVASPSTHTLAGYRAQLDSLAQLPVDQRSWPQLKRIVDRVHSHTCGHASYSDIRSLLERNGLWTPAVSHYLNETIEKCVNCVASSSPMPSRRVAISNLNRSFKETVCIDHFYLDDIRLFHTMDTVSR